jgi:hypothetical protein
MVAGNILCLLHIFANIRDSLNILNMKYDYIFKQTFLLRLILYQFGLLPCTEPRSRIDHNRFSLFKRSLN